MEFLPSGNRSMKPSPATLILPALSIGNVGQLAVDLLISSMQSEKVGYLDDPSVLPCIGNDPFGPEANGELTVALEVYEGIDYDIRIVQQRSPVIKGTMMKFAKNLALWAHNYNTKEVIILSGMNSGKLPRHDISPQVYYISTENADGTDKRCEHLGWKRFDHFSPSNEAWKLLESQSLTQSVEDESIEVPLSDENYFPSMPVASLFSCCKAQGLKAICVLWFCSEGDNVPDAFFLGEALHNLLHLSTGEANGQRPLKWVVPLSWRTVYGPPPDQSIYC